MIIHSITNRFLYYVHVDTDLKSKVDVLYSSIEKSAKKPVGRTLVTLDHTQCRLRECNLGEDLSLSLSLSLSRI